MEEIKFAFLNNSVKCKFIVLKLVHLKIPQSDGTEFLIYIWRETADKEGKHVQVYEVCQSISDALKKWQDATIDLMGEGFMLHSEG